MKAWLAAGHIDQPTFFNQLNLLHQDFSGLQQLLNNEQSDISSREQRKPSVSWGRTVVMSSDHLPPRDAALDSSSLGAQEGQTTGWRNQNASGSQTHAAQPKTGWGSEATSRARSESGWRGGPATDPINSISTVNHHSPHRSQRFDSESTWNSGNNHDNHKKWQRAYNDCPPPSADFSERGRSRDRHRTDRNVNSHDRANRSRSISPDVSRDSGRRHYPPSPSQANNRSRTPHVVASPRSRDQHQRSSQAAFKPPHQLARNHHHRSKNDGSLPPLLSASPSHPTERDSTFYHFPSPNRPNKRPRSSRAPQPDSNRAKHSASDPQLPSNPPFSPYANPLAVHHSSPRPQGPHGIVAVNRTTAFSPPRAVQGTPCPQFPPPLSPRVYSVSPSLACSIVGNPGSIPTFGPPRLISRRKRASSHRSCCWQRCSPRSRPDGNQHAVIHEA